MSARAIQRASVALALAALAACSGSPPDAAGDDGLGDAGSLLGGPWPFTVQESGWSAIDIAAVPLDAPGADERLLRADAHADGLRWRVTVEFDECQDTYGRAREALVAAGFAVVSEDSDPERPSWSLGVFRDHDHDVELETSNETGGGCFGDDRITAR